MKVQVSNPQGLQLYLSDVNPIFKQLEEVEEIEDYKCEIGVKQRKR